MPNVTCHKKTQNLHHVMKNNNKEPNKEDQIKKNRWLFKKVFWNAQTFGSLRWGGGKRRIRTAKEATTILKSHTEKCAAWKFSVRLFKESFSPALRRRPPQGNCAAECGAFPSFEGTFKNYFLIKKLALLIFTCAVTFDKNQLMPQTDLFFTHFFGAKWIARDKKKPPSAHLFSPLLLWARFTKC